MFVNKKLVKRRVFRSCTLPTMSDLFKRLGPRVSSDSFDSMSEPLPIHSSKIESLGYIAEFDDALNRESMRQSRTVPVEDVSSSAPTVQ